MKLSGVVCVVQVVAGCGTRVHVSVIQMIIVMINEDTPLIH